MKNELKVDMLLLNLQLFVLFLIFFVSDKALEVIFDRSVKDFF